MQLIKGKFSFRLASRSPVWQSSFTHHHIRDAEDYERHRLYIHRNPVCAGLVQRPEDYTYSSAQAEFVPDGIPPELRVGVSALV